MPSARHMPEVLGLGTMICTPGFYEIVPFANLFGVAFADQKNNGRGVRRAVFRQTLLPVPID